MPHAWPLDLLLRGLARCGRHGTAIFAVAIFVGLLFPPAAEAVRPFLAVTVFGLMTTVLVRVDMVRALEHVRKPGLVIAFMLALTVGTPLVVVGLLAAFGDVISHDVALALVLFACAPPLVSASSTCYLMGLDGALSLVLTLLGTALSPLVVPAVVALAGFEVDISSMELAMRLALLVGAAAVSARLIRGWMGAERLAACRPQIDGAAVVMIVIFAVAAMDGVLWTLLDRPAFTLALVALAFGMSLGLMGAIRAAFAATGVITSRTLAFTGGMRNMGLGIASMGAAVPHDTWIYFALVQFPIYLLPMALQYVWRASDRRRAAP
ncbi:hypothetical protein [Futiania mangrovi]|uniref:Na+-dependent transporter n=1 Tax=Futiania mangrovi TaxID=2959716 RepID=A0A9J6PCC1_9PROT|nr:hypothetical protein [Futiania mangrovii]MCP1335432.1 hypothetical protein [Futiania mangrovii]